MTMNKQKGFKFFWFFYQKFLPMITQHHSLGEINPEDLKLLF